MRALNANLHNWFLCFFDQLNCIPLVRARNHVRPPWGDLTMDQTISAVGHNLTSHLHVRPPDLDNSLKK